MSFSQKVKDGEIVHTFQKLYEMSSAKANKYLLKLAKEHPHYRQMKIESLIDWIVMEKKAEPKSLLQKVGDMLNLAFNRLNLPSKSDSADILRGLRNEHTPE
jgi:hypothetical protein